VSQDAAGRLGRRLQRILLLLPYAIRHPGVTVDELSLKFGVDKLELMDDLNLVFMCGLPGYGPGDLIDVSIEEDKVYVRMADYFSAPLRLSPAEALALYAGGAATADLPEMKEADSLRRALVKLGRALGIAGNGDGTSGINVRLEDRPDAHLRTMQRALREAKQVQLEYWSASRGALTKRAVDPWGLVAALGRWYLIGFDHSSDEERMFRLDRIKEASVTDMAAPVPDDFDPDRYKGAFSDRDATPNLSFEISPDVSRWFEDYYPVARSTILDDEWRKVELVSSGERWAATLVLRLGEGVRDVQPKSVVKEAARLASAIAARHAN
jgi:proteasome accessory factor C